MKFEAPSIFLAPEHRAGSEEARKWQWAWQLYPARLQSLNSLLGDSGLLLAGLCFSSSLPSLSAHSLPLYAFLGALYCSARLGGSLSSWSPIFQMLLISNAQKFPMHYSPVALGVTPLSVPCQCVCLLPRCRNMSSCQGRCRLNSKFSIADTRIAPLVACWHEPAWW